MKLIVKLGHMYHLIISCKQLVEGSYYVNTFLASCVIIIYILSYLHHEGICGYIFYSYLSKIYFLFILCILYCRNGRFGHGTQEDSHEVLRYLLSVLREEEIEVTLQFQFIT